MKSKKFLQPSIFSVKAENVLDQLVWCSLLSRLPKNVYMTFNRRTTSAAIFRAMKILPENRNFFLLCWND